MSSSEPRRYIKKDRPRSIVSADSKHITTNHNQNGASLSNSCNAVDHSTSLTEKKVKIQLPKKENESNNLQNVDEWTEISLNNSPEELPIESEVYSDEEDQVPYKPLERELSPESSMVSSNTKGNVKRKKLVTQKSLPAMAEKNEISLSDEKKAQVTRSPSFKRKGKLDNCLPTWISRNSAGGEMSAGSSG